VVTFKPFVEDDAVIPNERTRPNTIPLIPQAKYIKNTNHFKKYKFKIDKEKMHITNYETRGKALTDNKDITDGNIKKLY